MFFDFLGINSNSGVIVFAVYVVKITIDAGTIQFNRTILQFLDIFSLQSNSLISLSSVCFSYES